MASGFVEIRIDTHHEFDLAQCGIECSGMRSRKHRVTANGDHRSDLAFARCRDFFGEASHGEFTADFGIPAHAAMAPSDAETATTTLAAAAFVRSEREHCPTG